MISHGTPLALSELASRCGCEPGGSSDVIISSAAAVEDAVAGSIVFATDDRFLAKAEESQASAILISRRARDVSKPAIRAANVRLCWARVLAELYPAASAPPGVHASSVVAQSVRIDSSASVGPHCFIGESSVIEKGCSVGAGTVIGRGVSIGPETVIFPRVVIGDGCIIGPRNMLLPGAIIGAEGFGLARDGDRYVRIPHIGIVRTGSDVEIGANTTVDRAALGETMIADGVKIDNLVQIAHNVVIGSNTVIAAQTGIAGSTRVGASVTMAGQVGIIDHVTIGERAVLTAQSVVISSVAPGAIVGGYPAGPHREFLRSAALLRRLPALVKEWQKRFNRVSEAGDAGKDRDAQKQNVND